MDSLTHVVLGATVAETVAGKKLGNKALLIGAIAGNIPDLDSVFTVFLNPVDALFFHRGISHSFLVLALAAPILAYLLSKISDSRGITFCDWLWAIALPWLSHLIVDIFNTYGTGLFEPYSGIRASYDSVAIIDFFILAVIIPLVGVIAFINKNKRVRRLFAWAAIFYMVAYFGLSVFIKQNLESRVKQELAAEGTEYLKIQTAPLPLTNLIWMVVVEDSLAYNVHQRHILRNKPELKHRLIKNHHLLSTENSYEVNRIRAFTKGLYTVKQQPNGWIIYDLRYSSLAQTYPDAYVFKFNVVKQPDRTVVERAHPKRNMSIENIKLYISRLY